MKKNSKKRVLLSSVAMLMVGAVSLGTATFAWFTQDTTARTENLGVRTAKTSTLEISANNNVWGSIVDYEAANTLLIPTSTDDGSNWFNAVAAEETAFGSATGTMKKLDSSAGYAFVNQLNIRNAGEVAVENVNIKFTLDADDADYDYVRVALVPAAAMGEGKNNTGEFIECVYANDLTQYDAVASVTGTGEDQTFGITKITPAKNGEITIKVADSLAGVKTVEGQKPVYTEKYYNLYVWFEGQDGDCYNTNAGVEIPNIEFTVTGTPKTEAAN